MNHTPCERCGEPLTKAQIRNKGRYCSKSCASKEKAEALVAFNRSEAGRRKTSEQFLGKPLSSEHKAKIAGALRGKPLTEERKERIRGALSGRKLREDHRQKLVGRPCEQATRDKISSSLLGRVFSEEHRRAIGVANTKRVFSDEQRTRLAKQSKEWWAGLSLDQRREHLANCHAVVFVPSGRRTSIELAIEAELRLLELDFEAQKPIGWYHVDFYVPRHNLVIECDGEYWHSRPEQIAKDRQRDAWLSRHGYKIARIPEHAIRMDARAALFEALGEDAECA